MVFFLYLLKSDLITSGHLLLDLAVIFGNFSQIRSELAAALATPSQSVMECANIALAKVKVIIFILLLECLHKITR